MQKNHQPENRYRFIRNIVLCSVLLIPVISAELIAAPAEDSNSSAVEPLALRGIMSDLGKNMQRITDGIAREDWQKVEESALLIADHPTPPFTEKARILAYVGTDMSKFKTKDNATHEAAMVVAKAAQEKDGYKIIEDFAALQKTCLACHQKFRQSFVDHFYK